MRPRSASFPQLTILVFSFFGCPSATYRCVHSSPWGIFEPLALVPFLTGPNT